LKRSYERLLPALLIRRSLLSSILAIRARHSYRGCSWHHHHGGSQTARGCLRCNWRRLIRLATYHAARIYARTRVNLEPCWFGPSHCAISFCYFRAGAALAGPIFISPRIEVKSIESDTLLANRDLNEVRPRVNALFLASWNFSLDVKSQKIIEERFHETAFNEGGD
jgi:hypothetical protein